MSIYTLPNRSHLAWVPPALAPAAAPAIPAAAPVDEAVELSAASSQLSTGVLLPPEGAAEGEERSSSICCAPPLFTDTVGTETEGINQGNDLEARNHCKIGPDPNQPGTLVILVMIIPSCSPLFCEAAGPELFRKDGTNSVAFTLSVDNLVDRSEPSAIVRR